MPRQAAFCSHLGYISSWVSVCQRRGCRSIRHPGYEPKPLIATTEIMQLKYFLRYCLVWTFCLKRLCPSETVPTIYVQPCGALTVLLNIETQSGLRDGHRVVMDYFTCFLK